MGERLLSLLPCTSSCCYTVSIDGWADATALLLYRNAQYCTSMVICTRVQNMTRALGGTAALRKRMVSTAYCSTVLYRTVPGCVFVLYAVLCYMCSTGCTWCRAKCAYLFMEMLTSSAALDARAVVYRWGLDDASVTRVYSHWISRPSQLSGAAEEVCF